MNASVRNWLPLAVLLLAAAAALGQGTFAFSNPGARTRMESINGALADGSIFAQMLVGLDPSSLSPVGMPKPHHNGIVVGEIVTVPGIPANTVAYMRMSAWNTQLWGSHLAEVPANQIGWTDIVPVLLAFSFDPASLPYFNQPAIVPVPVPEPAAWAFGVLGLLGFLLYRRRP